MYNGCFLHMFCFHIQHFFLCKASPLFCIFLGNASFSMQRFHIFLIFLGNASFSTQRFPIFHTFRQCIFFEKVLHFFTHSTNFHILSNFWSNIMHWNRIFLWVTEEDKCCNGYRIYVLYMIAHSHCIDRQYDSSR